MAMHDRNPSLRRSREHDRDKATPTPVARLTPTPHPRTAAGLPKRSRGRHRLSDDPRLARGQFTADKVEKLAAEYRAKQHITEVQNLADAGQAS